MHLKKLRRLVGGLSSFIHSPSIPSKLQLIDTAELEPRLSPHSLPMAAIMNDYSLRQAFTRCLSVSATNVVLPKLLSQSFNLLTPEKRDTRLNIFHCSLGLPLPSPISLCPCNVCFSKAQSYPLSSPSASPSPIFSLSFVSALCRIPICFSGDTNWKIA